MTPGLLFFVYFHIKAFSTEFFCKAFRNTFGSGEITHNLKQYTLCFLGVQREKSLRILDQRDCFIGTAPGCFYVVRRGKDCEICFCRDVPLLMEAERCFCCQNTG